MEFLFHYPLLSPSAPHAQYTRAGSSPVDQKTAPHLSDPRYLLKCDALSSEEVVKTVQTPPQGIMSFAQCEIFLPACFGVWDAIFILNQFPRYHALLRFVTSSFANPITVNYVISDYVISVEHLYWDTVPQSVLVFFNEQNCLLSSFQKNTDCE